MGRSWCADIPLVGVPRSDVPKCLTLILPFYSNQEFFNTTQLPTWRGAEYDGLREFVSVLVVDDGSPEPAYLPAMDSDRPFSMRLFRIKEDRRWNWIAARNIGAHHAADGWLLLTDMDHVVPAATLAGLVYGQHEPDMIHGFSRVEHTGQELKPHANSFFMTREMFWRIGGYDEHFSGFYGSDGEYRRRCAKTAPMAIIADPLIRYEYVQDSSTTRYKRKQPEDVAIQRMVAARTADWRPKVLSFPYGEVTC